MQQPADRHVCVDRAGKLARPESRGVLEDSDELVVGNELLQEGTVDVAALVALAEAPSGLNIAGLFEPRIVKLDPWCVLQIADCKVHLKT